MTRLIPVATLRVVHDYDGPDAPCPALRPALLDDDVARSHRLVVRLAPGEARVFAHGRPGGGPRFPLPDPVRLRFALLTVDPIVETVTAVPSTLRPDRPDHIAGVRPRAMPLFRHGAGDTTLSAEPAWIATGAVRIAARASAPVSSAPVSYALRDADGAEIERGEAAPDPDTGEAAIAVTLPVPAGGAPAPSHPGPWWLTVGEGTPAEETHALFAGPLPAGSFALVDLRVEPPTPARTPDPIFTVSLAARRAKWTYRVLLDPREPAPSDASLYAIEHDADPPAVTFPAPTLITGERPTLVFESATEVPSRRTPVGPLTLYRGHAPESRAVLVERLPTPSPRAPRADVTVYL